MDAQNIKVNIYASEDPSSDGHLVQAINWNYANCGWTDEVIATAYVQNKGFITPSVGSGEVAGTVGQNLPMEGLRLSTTTDIKGVGLVYDVHVQNLGWMNHVSEGSYAGTMNLNLPIEAVHIGLTGENASNYSIQYQVHIQNLGWQDWKENGQEAGTTGRGLAIEALRIQLVPSGTPLSPNN